MPNFSKEPQLLLQHNVDASYVGVRMTQGVPVLDRDLNLRSDLLGATIRRVFSRHIGEGTIFGDDDQFEIVALAGAPNDFRINAGTILVGGVEVTSLVAFNYSNQPIELGEPAIPALPTTVGGPARVDLIYVEVWLGQVDSTKDNALYNSDDFEIETSVRLVPRWRVRLVNAQTPLPTTPGHVYYLLAELSRPANSSAILPGMLTDKRTTDLCMDPLLGRLATLDYSVPTMKKFLSPTFTEAPYSHPYGYAGLCLTIQGSRLNFGDVKVELRVANEGVRAPWVEATIVDMPQSNSLTVRLPPNVSGAMWVAVTNGVGKALVPATLYIYGPPAFHPHQGMGVGDQIWPLSVHANQTVTLKGQFFNMPGAVVETCVVGDLWDPVQIVPAMSTATKIEIKAPVAAGHHKIRVTTPASPIAATSTEMLYIHP